MAKSYLAPELLSYGSVKSLTSVGFFKCTPMPDSGGFGHTVAAPDGVKDPAEGPQGHCLDWKDFSP